MSKESLNWDLRMGLAPFDFIANGKGFQGALLCKYGSHAENAKTITCITYYYHVG